jgi:hypothetical protein
MLIVGYRAASKYKGWTALRCERCERALPFMVIENTTAHSVYLIELLKNVRTIVVCDFCGSAFDAQDEPAIIRKWSAKDGLQVLVDATNPSLGSVDDSKKPTDAQLKALLDCTAEQARVSNKHVGRGLFAGWLAGSVLGWGAGYCLGLAGMLAKDQNPPVTLGALGLIVGGLVGVLPGGYIYGRIRYRRQAREALKQAIRRHRIEMAQLKIVARFYQHSVEPIIASLE